MSKIFSHIVNEKFHIRSNKDRRKKVNTLLLSYIDEKGYEYRKLLTFDAKCSYEQMLEAVPYKIE